MDTHNKDKELEAQNEQEGVGFGGVEKEETSEDMVSQPEEGEHASEEETAPAHRGKYKVPPLNTEETRHFLSGMYQEWFLDYASYVNL